MINPIKPDLQKARSIIKMNEYREKFLSSIPINTISSTIIAELYYEVIKIYGTTILFLDGKKATGEFAERELMEYLKTQNILSSSEVWIADDLRIKTNYSKSEGKGISEDYMTLKRLDMLKIIRKLKSSVLIKLGEEPKKNLF